MCREGEEGDNFYVIESGEYIAVKGGREVFKYEGHGAFGELALLYNCLRAATVQVGDSKWPTAGKCTMAGEGHRFCRKTEAAVAAQEPARAASCPRS